MRINFDEIEKDLPFKSEGYISLKKDVMDDIANCINCNSCLDPCRETYCSKFDWILKRAKEYGEVSGVHFTKILDTWEEKRSYWYMNYYQESNQPKLDSSTENLFIFDSIKELRESVEHQEFRCPHCKGITTDPYDCNSGVKCFPSNPDKVCDWKVYGLFGDLGKGAKVYVKDQFYTQTIFMPIDWEKKDDK